jgi:hypothetical protein
MVVMKKRLTSGKKTNSLPNMVFLMTKEIPMKKTMPEQMVVEKPRRRH